MKCSTASQGPAVRIHCQTYSPTKGISLVRLSKVKGHTTALSMRSGSTEKSAFFIALPVAPTAVNQRLAHGT
jgi:hypothetical protein